MTSLRSFHVLESKDYGTGSPLTHDLAAPQRRDPHSHSRSSLCVDRGLWRRSRARAPQRVGRRRSLSRTEAGVRRDRLSIHAGEHPREQGYGVLRPSQCAVPPPMRQPVRMRVLPTAPGRGCDNTLRRAVYLPARHGSGTKEVPARRASPHDAPLSTSHQPAHTTGTVAPGDGPFSPGRASIARNGTRSDSTTSVSPSVHRQLHAGLSAQRQPPHETPSGSAGRASRSSVHRSAGTVTVPVTAAVSGPATVRRSRPHPNQAP